MEFQNYFPVWGKLTAAQQDQILGHLMSRRIPKGTVIHNGSMDCTGLLLVKSGQLRAYILSDEGREITIYRSLVMASEVFPFARASRVLPSVIRVRIMPADSKYRSIIKVWTVSISPCPMPMPIL